MGGVMLVASWGLKTAMRDAITAAGQQVNSADVVASTGDGGSTGGGSTGGGSTGGGSGGGSGGCVPHGKSGKC
jgi:hypothetical protein